MDDDIKPTRLSARLYAVDDSIVLVPGVPPAAPATAGVSTVEIPYPAAEPPRVIRRVVIINEDIGPVADSTIYPVRVWPGDKLSVPFREENLLAAAILLAAQHASPLEDVPAYRPAGRITTGFDGGNYPLRGDVLRCTSCGSLLLHGDQELHSGSHKAVRANLASLNEIIYELTARVSDDPGFTAMVRELLREHSHAVGFEFRGDGGGIGHSPG